MINLFEYIFQHGVKDESETWLIDTVDMMLCCFSYNSYNERPQFEMESFEDKIVLEAYEESEGDPDEFFEILHDDGRRSNDAYIIYTKEDADECIDLILNKKNNYCRYVYLDNIDYPSVISIIMEYIKGDRQ